MVRPWSHVAAVIAACCWLPDLLVRGPAFLTSGGSALLYGLSFIPSLLLWVVMLRALGRVRARFPRSGRALTWVAGLLVYVLQASLLGYWVRFRFDPASSAFAFFMRYPIYAFTLIGSAASKLQLLLVFAVAPILSVAAVDWLTRRPLPTLRAPRWAPELVGLAVVALAVAQPKLPATADIRALATVISGTWEIVAEPSGLPDPDRIAVPRATPRRAPDVLLVLHESLGRFQWHPWSGDDDTSRSPRVSEFLQSHRAHAVWFARAVTSAPSTRMSVPSLLSGLAVDATRDEFMRAPLLWHYARAMGYRTALFTSQNYDWANFDRFLVGADRPDTVATSADFPDAARVNDDGLDDRVVVEAASRWLEETARTDPRPVFIMVQLNSTHGPYYSPGVDKLPDLTMTERYARSAAYVDAMGQTLIDTLQRVGRLDRTLVIGTSDHGEILDRPDRPPRVENLDETTAGVPFWVHLPPSIAAAEPGLMDALRGNARARTGNVDIVPTVLDLWGLWPLTGDVAALPISGHSLLRPIPADRRMICTNSAPIRAWRRAALAVYYGDLKWLADEKGFYVYDLATDPREEHNLRDEVAPTARARFLGAVARRKSLRTRLERLEPDLGPAIRAAAKAP